MDVLCLFAALLMHGLQCQILGTSSNVAQSASPVAIPNIVNAARLYVFASSVFVCVTKVLQSLFDEVQHMCCVRV